MRDKVKKDLERVHRLCLILLVTGILLYFFVKILIG